MLPLEYKREIAYLDRNASLCINTLKIFILLLSNYMLIYAMRDINIFDDLCFYSTSICWDIKELLKKLLLKII